MANRTFGTSRRIPVRSQRRKTSWIIGLENTLISVFTSAGPRLWTLGVATGQDANTIVRIRGEYTVSITQGIAAGELFASVALGIGLVTDEAFAAGITSIPSPLTDRDWDGWMWHRLHGMFITDAPNNETRGPMEAVRVEIDSKSMRKFDEGMTVFGAIELGAETGACSIDFTAQTRMLIKLP